MKILQSSLVRAVMAFAVGALIIKYREETVHWLTVVIGALFFVSGLISVVLNRRPTPSLPKGGSLESYSESNTDVNQTPSPREGGGGSVEGEPARGRFLFRPPHGWLRHSVYYWLSKEFRIVMWDLVTRDYSKWLTADDVYENVRRYARNGSIITFHDSLKSIDKLHTALPRSIEWLQEQGYEFRTF